MNTIPLLYANIDQWDFLATQFLEGSDRLANGIAPFNYSTLNKKHRMGYHKSLILAVTAGIQQKPLTPTMLLEWENLILSEENWEDEKSTHSKKIASFCKIVNIKIESLIRKQKLNWSSFCHAFLWRLKIKIYSRWCK